MTLSLDLASSIFFPYLSSKRQQIVENDLRFVHYTSAEVAIRILQNKSVWMRNSVTMNDFEEVQYGMKALQTAYKGATGARFRVGLENMFPGASQIFEEKFDALGDSLRTNTYLTSFSEHPKEEDDCGRLSMWRAYGGSSGVAIVIRPQAFALQTTALASYSSPVIYGADKLDFWFSKIVDNLQAHKVTLQQEGQETLLNTLLTVSRFAVLCTKHPGFAEEKEWRVLHSLQEPSSLLVKSVEVVRGIPQLVCKLPLEDFPEQGVVGLSPNALVDRIIIGPTSYPLVVYEAFKRAMTDAGIENAASKLWVSNIPLRQN